MRILQIVLCILACLCVAAAAITGAFLQDLTIVLCLIGGAFLFGAGMFLVRRFLELRAERKARKNRRDFMDADPPQNQSGDGN